MPLKIAYAALLALCLAACTKPETPTATLTIKTNALPDTEVKISLASADTALTTAHLVGGMANVTLPLTRPDLLVIEIPNLRMPIVFFADIANMTVTINGDMNPPSFTIEGSAYQDSLDAFAGADRANEMLIENYRNAWENALMASDSLTLPIISAKIDSAYYAHNAYKLAFAKRNGIIGAMITQRYIYQIDFADLNAIYENIPVLFKEDEFVKNLKARVDILKNTQIGMRFTDIAQQDTSGKELAISEIPGTYILIDFWASWCGPCRAVNPELVSLYTDFKSAGFEIVGVSLDKYKAAWQKAILDDGLTWYHMSDLKGWQNEGAAAYGVREIPQNVLIDNQGFIVRKNLSTSELRTFLEENL